MADSKHGKFVSVLIPRHEDVCGSGGVLKRRHKMEASRQLNAPAASPHPQLIHWIIFEWASDLVWTI
jgi:hypothetical protein